MAGGRGGAEEERRVKGPGGNCKCKQPQNCPLTQTSTKQGAAVKFRISNVFVHLRTELVANEVSREAYPYRV